MNELCPICRTRYRKVARNHGKPGRAIVRQRRSAGARHVSAVIEAAAAADKQARADARVRLVQKARVEADAAEIMEFTKLAALLRELAYAVEEGT